MADNKWVPDLLSQSLWQRVRIDPSNLVIPWYLRLGRAYDVWIDAYADARLPDVFSFAGTGRVMLNLDSEPKASRFRACLNASRRTIAFLARGF